MFARDARTLLMQHHGQLELVRFEYMYLQHFHVSLSPASYGQPNLLSLLLAVPHVIALRGKSYQQQIVMLTPRFHGKCNCFCVSQPHPDGIPGIDTLHYHSCKCGVG